MQIKLEGELLSSESQIITRASDYVLTVLVLSKLHLRPTLLHAFGSLYSLPFSTVMTGEEASATRYPAR